MSEGRDASWDFSPISCAFCLGDPERIAGAFLGHLKQAFRTGQLTDRFVELGVCYADVATRLPDAVADVVGVPRLIASDPVFIAGGDDDGMWVELLPHAWVALIASVPATKTPEVLARWADLSQEGYDPDPDTWNSPVLAGALQGLVDIAAEAASTGRPLLGLAAL